MVEIVVKTVDDRSPMAKSLSKVSEIIAMCMLTVVPALIGYLVDQQIGTVFLFTLLGLVLGMFGAIKQLVALVAIEEQPKKGDEDSKEFESQEEGKGL
ncbi:MAG: F0F1-type ATP synthase assembly protein I [Mariniblastus sp.]